MLKCPTFILKRQCFLGKLASIGVTFPDTMPDDSVLNSILCPTTPIMAKIVSKYFMILFRSRKRLDEGATLDELGHINATCDYNEDDEAEINSFESDDDDIYSDESEAETT